MAKIIVSVALSLIHVLAADILFFYGSVIDPQLSHKIINAIAFTMLLPFSGLLLIPGAGDYTNWIQILIIGFWAWVYFRILSCGFKACRRLAYGSR